MVETLPRGSTWVPWRRKVATAQAAMETAKAIRIPPTGRIQPCQWNGTGHMAPNAQPSSHALMGMPGGKGNFLGSVVEFIGLKIRPQSNIRHSKRLRSESNGFTTAGFPRFACVTYSYDRRVPSLRSGV